MTIEFHNLTWGVSMTDQEWFDIDQAAAWMGLPSSAIRDAVARGQLPAVQIGDYVRLSRSALLMAAGQAPQSPAIAESQAAPPEPPVPLPITQEIGGIPVPTGLSWVQEPEPGALFTAREGSGHVYHFPRKKDVEPDVEAETYTAVWNATISLHGRTMPVVVGQSKRYGLGRLTVWIDRYPVVEFVSTRDGTGWASMIQRGLKIGEQIPALYRRCKVEPYRLVTGMAGSGVPNTLAVVVDRDDIRSIVHHAAVRWLSKRNLSA
jgi:excisionase family DNA binding protein